MFSSLTNGYDDLVKAIIRPPRDVYDPKDLGPEYFKVQGVKVKREDFVMVNSRGMKLCCSFFEPVNKPCDQLPCVVYLHGNSSSRLECYQCIDLILSISLFSFDFAGCGLSEGEYISLGWYERDDVELAVEWLRKSNRVSTIGLWGRSMGAVTALMHADRDPSIAGLVLDSPFSNLRTLAEELAKNDSKVPSFVVSSAIGMIRKSVQTKAKFDIDDLNPLKNHVKKAFIPAFFIAGEQDTFINPHHAKKLHEEYAGDKNLVIVDGDHNSRRPPFLLNSIAIFFYNTLQVKYLVPDVQVRFALIIFFFKIGKEEPIDKEFKEFNINNIMRGVGNEYMVHGALGQFEDDEEELRKAIEESLKISAPQQPPVQPQPQPQQPQPVQPQQSQQNDLLTFSDEEK